MVIVFRGDARTLPDAPLPKRGKFQLENAPVNAAVPSLRISNNFNSVPDEVDDNGFIDLKGAGRAPRSRFSSELNFCVNY